MMYPCYEVNLLQSSDSSMSKSHEDIEIRIGTAKDAEQIEVFASVLLQNPKSSRDKWLKVIENKNVYPLLAAIDGRIVGKIQARIMGDYGWIESTRVLPKLRNKGIAKRLVDEGIKWIIEQGAKSIWTSIDSDNLTARYIVERKGFKGNFISINPSCWVTEEDRSPDDLSRFTTLLDNNNFKKIENLIREQFSGIIMIDGQYIPFSWEIFNYLINEKRILINGKKNMLLIYSTNKLPEEFHVFGIGLSVDHYEKIGGAAKALAVQNMASTAICHGPSKRETVEGLVKSGFGWNQPHTLIIYQKDL